MTQEKEMENMTVRTQNVISNSIRWTAKLKMYNDAETMGQVKAKQIESR